ncbi:unnamed protein product [Amoebophrya sp. A120]|nr:unnamed protein product [Amoebophrya sp. A120]|eukprot:GSA120T00010439001.1
MTMSHIMKSATEITAKEMQDAAYWRSLVPFLTVGGEGEGEGTDRRQHRSSSATKKAHSRGPTTSRTRTTSRQDASIRSWRNAAKYRKSLQTHGYAVIPKDDFQITSVDDRKSLPEEGCKKKNRAEEPRLSSAQKSRPLIRPLAEAAQILHDHGWPATFLAVYDEAWELAKQCQSWMDEVSCNQNKFCFDIVGFHVVDGTGFSPHRDRQPEDWQPKGHLPEDPRTTFSSASSAENNNNDGDHDHDPHRSERANIARYLTCWVALTDATPARSCLHYVSATVDPGYYAGDSLDGDPMGRIFGSSCTDGTTTTKGNYQKIFCASVNAGGFCCHTHRVIHWGNQGEDESQAGDNITEMGVDAAKNPGSDERESNRRKIPDARVALSFAFTNNDNTSFEPPNLLLQAQDGGRDSAAGKEEKTTCASGIKTNIPAVPLNLRLALCSAQVINYSMLSLGDPKGWKTLAGRKLQRKHLSKFYKVFQQHETHFHEHYRKEIATKFVAVSLEKQEGKMKGKGMIEIPQSERPADHSQVQEGDTAMELPSRSSNGRKMTNKSNTTVEESKNTRASEPITEAAGVKKKTKKKGKKKRLIRIRKKVSTDTKNLGIIAGADIATRAAAMYEEADSEGELEDAALEAMLNSEKNIGSVLFHDDFDVQLAAATH